MHWVAPSAKDLATDALEKRLWDTADQFRANSGLIAPQSSGPSLGLLRLRLAEVRFAVQRAKLEHPSLSGRGVGGERVARGSRRGSPLDEPAADRAGSKLYS